MNPFGKAHAKQTMSLHIKSDASLVIYDFDGNRNEAVRLHGEIGLMWNKRWYFSAGYTPFMNSLYRFNEYWFVGMYKKIPVSFVFTCFKNRKAKRPT